MPTQNLQKHLPYLLLGLAVPLLASWLVVVDGEQVGVHVLPGLLLPPSCLWRSLFEVDCPGCGLTRSIVYLVQNRLDESLAMHRLGWLVFLLIVSQVPYRLWHLSGRRPQIVWSRQADFLLWGGLISLLLLNRVWDFLATL